MQAMWRITWLWPGLERLWFGGRWSGLAVAVLFAVLVNAALFAGLIRPDLVPAPLGIAAGVLAIGVWVLDIARSMRGHSSYRRTLKPDNPQDRFCQAQREYLRGNWSGTQALIDTIIRDDPHDVEALLLRASVCRRTGAADTARRSLRQVERLDERSRWTSEVQRELERLNR